MKDMYYLGFVDPIIKKTPIFWITSAGRRIDITLMDRNHIVNTINCLHGKGLTKIPGSRHLKNKWVDILTKELKHRL